MVTSNLILAISIGILASLSMNIGKGIQKWKVAVLKHKMQALNPEHRTSLFIWMIGSVMTLVAGPLFSIALNYADQPSMVTSLGGIGLIGVVIFSKVVLKEHITKTKAAGAGLIVIGTTLVTYFATKSDNLITFTSDSLIKLAIGFLVFLIILKLISLKYPSVYGKALALMAGSFLGLGMIIADVATVSSGGDMLAQFKEGYVYIAMVLGLSAFTFTQFALMREDGSIVIPMIHSMVIIASIVSEYFLYDQIVNAIQFAGVVIIIKGVFLLTRKAKTPFIFEGKE